MTLTIDGVTYQIKQGLNIKEAIADELDSAVACIVSNTVINSIGVNAPCVITEGTKTWRFIVKEAPTYVYENGIYTYVLQLVEPTVLLESVWFFGISYSQTSGTIADQLNRVVANMNQQSEYIEWHISPELANLMNSYPSRIFKWDKEVNAREIFDSMLAVADVAVRILSTTYPNIYISFDDPNLKGNALGTIESQIETTSQDASYLSAGITTVASNVILSKPIDEQYKELQCDSAVFKTSEAYYSTARGIDSVTSFKVMATSCRIIYNVIRSDNPLTGQIYNLDGNFEMDITEYVYDAEEFNSLPTNTSAKADKTRALYYERYNNKIENFFDASKSGMELISVSVMTRILDTESQEIYTGHTGPWSAVASAFNSVMPVVEGTTYSITGLSFGINNKTSRFSCSYIPSIDVYIDIAKPSVSSDRLKNTRIIDHQTEAMVDLKRFAQNLRGKSERSGNLERVLSLKHNNISDIYNLGDFDSNNYIVDYRELSIYSNYVLANYHLTKDFNNLSEAVSVNRAKEVFEIPLNGIRRRFVINRPIKVTRSNPNAIANTLKFWSGLLYKNSEYTVKSLALKCGPMYSSNVKAHMPCLGVAYENVVQFSALTLDNYAVAKRKVLTGSYYMLQSYPYVDSNGECSTMAVELCTSFTNGFIKSEAFRSLPEIASTDVYSHVVLPTNGAIAFSKDRNEALEIIVRCSLEAEQGITIGPLLTECSKLVGGTQPNLMLYGSNSTSTRLSRSKARCSLPLIGNYTGSADYLNGYGRYSIPTLNYKCIELGDADGNLYLAVENTANAVSTDVYFSFK